MTPKERHRFIKEVFNAALELKPAERSPYIRQACSDDSELISEVEELLTSDADEEIIGGLTKEISDRMMGTIIREGAGLIGKTVKGRFRIEKELSGGGMCDIYLGFDEKNRQTPVAIKILRRQTDHEVRDWLEGHFRSEARALARIDHPAVVKLIDAGETEDGKPFFAMEYVQGVNLRSEIEVCKGLKGGFERIARIMGQLGDAVGTSHQLGVYHRDLKPENIMLPKQGETEQIKIIDFGLATVKDLYDEKTNVTMFAAGSVCYMAPEQFTKKPGSASDVYALGAIAYEMATGRLPFAPKKTEYAEAIKELIELQKEGVKIKPRSLRFDLPQRAEDAILKALSYNPKDRFKRAKEFTDELVAALSEKREAIEDRNTTVATTVINQSALGRSNIKKRLQKICLAAMAIIAVAAGAAGIINLTSDRENAATDGARSICYWAMLQRYDEKRQPKGKPIRLNSITGQTYGNKGDGITLHFISEENGHLYVFDESMPEESRAGEENKERGYNILFPTRNANNGESEVRGGEEAAAVEGLFDEQSATERIWIIWTAKSESELEQIIKRARDGEVIGGDAEKLRGYIKARESREVKAEAEKEKKMMRLRFDGEALVYSMEIAYVGN